VPEEQQPGTTKSPEYLRVIRERAWVIILAVVVVLGATLALSFHATPQYRASAKLVYQTNNLDYTLFGAQVFSDTNQPRNVQTAAQMVQLPQVAEAVKKQLDSPRSGAQLLEMITVTSSTDTNLIQIDAVSPDAKDAADVANAFAKQFMTIRQNSDRALVASARELVKAQLDGLSAADAASDYGLMLKDKYESLQILESMQNGGFTQVQTALVPPAPFSPRPIRNGLLAVFAGLVVGLLLAFLLNYLDKRVKDTKVLEEVSGLPVLATVPAIGGRWRGHPGKDRSKSPVGFATHPEMLESFRTLRSSLQYFDVEKSIKTVLITSGLPREGKTVTTVNLALSLALAGNRVVIIEADLRRPMIPQYLGIDSEVGLSTVLATGVDVQFALRQVDLGAFVPEEVRDTAREARGFSLDEGLRCLASGPLPPNPAELLSSGLMGELLHSLSASALIDYVVIDTPPVLSVADALVLAPKVDAVILTTRMNWTTRAEAQETSDRLRRSGARVIGVVAMGEKVKSRHYSKRGYYQYGYR
jgi:polysaccharide biosynthesis transport protein